MLPNGLKVARLLSEVPVDFSKGKLVAALEAPVIWAVLLNGVVCEMDHSILQIVHRKLFGAGTDVALVVPIGSDLSAD